MVILPPFVHGSQRDLRSPGRKIVLLADPLSAHKGLLPQPLQPPPFTGGLTLRIVSAVRAESTPFRLSDVEDCGYDSVGLSRC